MSKIAEGEWGMRREKLLQEALSSLQAYPALGGLSSEETDALLRPLLDLACDVEDPQVEKLPDFVCKGCQAWLKDLAHHREVADARCRAIRQKLDEILEEDEEGVTGFVTVEKITTAQELAALTNRMTDVSRRALAQNKGLKVTLDMEIT